MKIIAIQNFIANNVVGFPGKELSEDECSDIQSLLEEMKREKLITVFESPPAIGGIVDEVKDPSQEDSQDGKNDDGMGDSQDMPSEELNTPLPQPKKKKK